MGASNSEGRDGAGAGEEGFTPAQDSEASDFECRLWDALDDIPDPHIPVSLVEMGMIYGVRVNEGDVTVEMTYPCLGCPAYDMIQDDIRSRLRLEEGIESIEIEVVWEPVWSKEMLTEEAQEKIREAGIGL